MTTQINGDTGVSQCQPNSVSQDDLQSGVVGKGPAFRAILAANFGPLISNVDNDLAGASITKVFDTSNGQAGFIFTAPVSGYYQISGQCTVYNGSTLELVESWLSISGVKVEIGSFAYKSGGNFASASSAYSTLVYLGAGQTAKHGVRSVGTGTLMLVRATFSGFLARAA